MFLLFTMLNFFQSIRLTIEEYRNSLPLNNMPGHFL